MLAIDDPPRGGLGTGQGQRVEVGVEVEDDGLGVVRCVGADLLADLRNVSSAQPRASRRSFRPLRMAVFRSLASAAMTASMAAFT